MRDPSNFFVVIGRFSVDTTWAETGDRYLLKLFRDYVFHQVSERGEPVIDMAHVVSCLNKVPCSLTLAGFRH